MADQPDTEGFLDRTYGLDTTEQVHQHYADWAATYEQELDDNGYATPARCADALAGQVEDLAAPVLDAGCGTGLSGLALRDAGFTVIDGYDYSDEMLAEAAAKPGVYRSLGHLDLAQPLPFAPGSYHHACAAGVINPGHVPPGAIEGVLAVLPAGGCFALSLNDHTLEEPDFATVMTDLIGRSLADVVVQERGPHLPGIELESTVYVLRKR